jgi:hypothetical protein
MPTSTWLQVPNTSTCLHVRAYNSYKYLPKSTRLQVPAYKYLPTYVHAYKYLPKSTRLQVPPYKYLLTSTSIQVPAYKYTCLES